MTEVKANEADEEIASNDVVGDLTVKFQNENDGNEHHSRSFGQFKKTLHKYQPTIVTPADSALEAGVHIQLNKMDAQVEPFDETRVANDSHSGEEPSSDPKPNLVIRFVNIVRHLIRYYISDHQEEPQVLS